MHVMAGVLCDGAGRVLLAQRPPGKHLAGLWEFPGGKTEPGESPQAALARELHEELGIDAGPGTPLIRVPWRYGERGLLLDAWKIAHWRGEARSLEGQALQWARPEQVDPALLAPADRPILQALRLPRHYAVTPADWREAEFPEALARLRRRIAQGGMLLQLRLPTWSRQAVRDLAAALLPESRRLGVPLLLNADVEGARQLGTGVQLKRSQLSLLAERPLPWRQLVGASCHDAAELAHAVRLGADFAALSPVLATASHPDAVPLDWRAFQALAEAAALPVYALGGVAAADVSRACEAGGQGVAGIRGFWGEP
ncbi:thiamine monophosphate synthase [Frateuria sp. Soil773]|nr:thiamine monophosphate synthase [Frateuria sp. Soil773]